MGDVINLRAARKAKSRVEKEKAADVNRVKFGRTKVQKKVDAADAKMREQYLDGVMIED